MLKFLAAICFVLLPVAAEAHKDRFLTINDSGDISGLPEQYGKVHITTSYNESRDVTGFSIKGPQFNVRLNQCVLRHLRGVSSLRASGSWYHDLSAMPAYVSINFVQNQPSPDDPIGTGTEITFSLKNGKILMAQLREKSWLGRPSGKVLQQASSCRDWR